MREFCYQVLHPAGSWEFLRIVLSDELLLTSCDNNKDKEMSNIERSEQWLQ